MPGVDAGREDAGTWFCVASSCDVGGDWQVTYSNIDGGRAGYCSPISGPLRLRSDGGEVCMQGAEQGEIDGGCDFSFVVRRNGFDFSGSEQWELHGIDAGVLGGTLSISMTFPSCSAAFTLGAVR